MKEEPQTLWEPGGTEATAAAGTARRYRKPLIALGAFITSLLFNTGKLLVGMYLGKTSLASTYGAAGSLVVCLFWVYYSALIFFLRAEFTQVFANRYGSAPTLRVRRLLLGNLHSVSTLLPSGR